MIGATEIIERIEAKVKTLAERLIEVEQTNRSLEEENEHLRHSLENITGNSGHEQDDSGELGRLMKKGGNMLGENEKWKKELDQHIAEIDDCITLLKEW